MMTTRHTVQIRPQDHPKRVIEWSVGFLFSSKGRQRSEYFSNLTIPPHRRDRGHLQYLNSLRSQILPLRYLDSLPPRLLSQLPIQFAT